jgi:hypothetical protein
MPQGTLGRLDSAISISEVSNRPGASISHRAPTPVGAMCGRYTLIRLADFAHMFPWINAPDQEPTARYNIARLNASLG